MATPEGDPELCALFDAWYATAGRFWERKDTVKVSGDNDDTGDPDEKIQDPSSELNGDQVTEGSRGNGDSEEMQEPADEPNGAKKVTDVNDKTGGPDKEIQEPTGVLSVGEEHGLGVSLTTGRKRKKSITNSPIPPGRKKQKSVSRSTTSMSTGRKKEESISRSATKYDAVTTAVAIDGNTHKDYQNHCLRTGNGGLGDSNEVFVCAYLGFDDLADFRRWMSTPPFLQAIDAFFTHGASKSFPNAMRILSKESSEFEGKSMAWASAKWPVKPRAGTTTCWADSFDNAEHMLAFLMYWLPIASESFLSKSLADQKREYEAVEPQLINSFRLLPWESVIGTGFKSPRWIHSNDKTYPAEKCCRVWGALRILWRKVNRTNLVPKTNAAASSVDGPESELQRKWNALWSSKTRFATSPVKESSKPVWMQSLHSTTSAGTAMQPLD